MAWLDRIFTRRRRQRCFGPVPSWARFRLRPACRQLSEQEHRMQELLGLVVPPRLTMADEELAILIEPAERRAIEKE
ncbi:hypothetical protein [Azospirillum sp. SYSU D00513]|uniref:hypothetical protein n=1 Tax=Azospirillum sp. SYSU D00513 TaxID=2812561 RepID=UPI001A957C3D|nr:hypothetical protein [Azospirillum sp. SYSU D00513]